MKKSRKPELVKKSGAFRLYRSVDRQWYWTIVASNGRTLATSETYKSRGSAVNGIMSAICNTNSTFMSDWAS